MNATRAKLFQNGGSQAVRLPKECRFIAQREVLVRREGRRVILEPVHEWSDEFRSRLVRGRGTSHGRKNRRLPSFETLSPDASVHAGR